jgi:hypothetical protein
MRYRNQFCGTPQRARHTSLSSLDDGGNDDDREISKKENDKEERQLMEHTLQVLHALVALIWQV